jgi:hypothetical protein
MILDIEDISKMKMYIQDLPDDVYNEIFSYCHLEEIILFSGTSQINRGKIISGYFKNIDLDKRIRRRCQERKKEKQLFFYNHIPKVPGQYLNNSIDMARIFCHIDDKFHKTTFTKRILRWNKQFKNNKCEWTCHHKTFYKYCLDEIKHYYYELY